MTLKLWPKQVGAFEINEKVFSNFPPGLPPPNLTVPVLPAGGEAAAGLAAETSVKALAARIEKALAADRLPEAIAYARMLAEKGDAGAAKALFDLGLRVEIPQFYTSVSKFLAGMAQEEVLDFYAKVSQGPNESAHMYLLEVLASLKHPRAAAIAAVLLGSRKVHVPRQAVATLRKVRTKECVEPLLNFLGTLERSRERGLMYEETRDALFEITGQDFDSLEDWKKWWSTAGASFEPDREDRARTRVMKPRRETVPTFVGQQIFSKKVLFVIDTSGTMQYVMKDDIPGLTGSDGSDSGRLVAGPTAGLSAKNAILAKFWTRLEAAKRELVKALKGFDETAYVNIIEFNRVARLLDKKASRCTKEYKDVGIRRVKNMTWNNSLGTDTLGALRLAFECDPDVTAMYFLSDGLPSRDGRKNDDPMPILEKVEVMNRFRKVKIHTFGIDPRSYARKEPHAELEKANEFLRQLAERTGGSFAMLTVTGERPPPDYR